ncbi:tRNA lysidine(34) synthetase TilS [Aliifodinibius salipaludis]|uniref:tRNA(Ile)-lysidine synthase n=1 Tax=Fodinibius salipaludis TaxID=2032627 RepID=A0A2A2G7D4_9BACT|nr:tRNA lysidine(34) synthetase TilS [Aliifodinibius salipaludis]PAU93050.1 tRNA lysidine(34) synthetase TilS [Aliifodinibius salipaludis]
MSRSNLSQIEQAVKESTDSIFDSSISALIIAVSGGVDSMSLLYSLYRLHIPGIIAHVNYQKRGEASDKDAELVAEKAGEWGFQFELKKANPGEAREQNFQQWAREVRYRFFRDLAEQYNADGIVLAHHKDDQIETVLQKLFRGAGMVSWNGMDVWDGELFRPLLSVSRQQIEQYAEQREIPYRTDESNLENDFARNFLRNEWTKGLSEFFPGWEENILSVGEYAQNYENALEWIANRVSDDNGLNKQAFDKLEPGLQRAMVLYLIKKEEPGIQISQQNLHRVSELKKLQTGKRIGITREFSIIRDREYYMITRSQNGTFKPRTFTRSDLENSTVEIGNNVLTLEQFSDPDLSKALFIDADKISWPITLRQWKEGDRLQPLGMKGHQSVAEHLTNRKVNAADKEKALIIESFEETICALIFPPIKNQSSSGTISEQVKCDSETKFCLSIK